MSHFCYRDIKALLAFLDKDGAYSSIWNDGKGTFYIMNQYHGVWFQLGEKHVENGYCSQKFVESGKWHKLDIKTNKKFSAATPISFNDFNFDVEEHEPVLKFEEFVSSMKYRDELVGSDDCLYFSPYLMKDVVDAVKAIETSTGIKGSKVSFTTEAGAPSLAMDTSINFPMHFTYYNYKYDIYFEFAIAPMRPLR